MKLGSGVTEHTSFWSIANNEMLSQMLLLSVLFPHTVEDLEGEVHTIVFSCPLPSPSIHGVVFSIFLIVPCFFNAVTSLQCSHLMYLIQM